MKLLRFLRILGISLLAIGAVGLGLGLMSSSLLIVSLGIRGFTSLLTSTYVAMGIGAASIVGGSVPVIVSKIRTQNNNRLLESNKIADSKNLTEYAQDSLNPEKTRARLEQLRRHNPNLSDIVEHCLDQMDRMDTYQARHKSLLDANEAIYLEDTIEIINESERRMCQNFRNIINCCILIEDTDSPADELDQKIIGDSFSDNDEELSTVSTLMKYSVAYINNYNRSGVKDRSELDAWIKVMKSSMEGNDESF